MKNKILKVLAIFFIFLIFLFIFLNSKKPMQYKIIDVIEADEFYIDINKNNKIDSFEHIKLKDVIAFKPSRDKNLDKYYKKHGLNYKNALKIGFLARNWARENLLKKDVLVYGIENCNKNEVCKVKIKYQNNDLSEFLLKNGLALRNENDKEKPYFQNFNFKQIKNNVAILSNLDFVFINLKTNIVHNLNCEHIDEISHGEILLKKDFKNYSEIFCKKCLAQKQTDKFKIPKSKGIYKKSIYKKFDDIELYLINPLEYDKPSSLCRNDFCKRLIQEINSAKNSIDVAIYGFGEQKEIYEALLNAKNRGVKIRDVVDYAKNIDEMFSYNSKFRQEFNPKENKMPSIMHNKFFIFDNKLLINGSVNISSTGSGGYNSNIAAVITDKEIIEAYRAEFEQMYALKFSTLKKKNNYSSTKLSVYFSPNGNVYQEAILPNIQNAKEKIYVSAFYLTDKNLIDELISAKKRGVEVLVILDATSANNFKDRLAKLRNNEIPTAVENWGGKNHEKTIGIDNEILILGSCNFSKSGFYKNDENILVIKDSKIASFYSDYFLYLLNSIDKKYFIFIPRAEGLESKNSCFDGLDNDYDGKIDGQDEACKS